MVFFFIMTVLCFTSHISYAYIYRVHTMQSGAGQAVAKRVIALSDYHDKKHPATVDQKIHLRDLLNTCKACKAHVIVEDLSSANTQGAQGCGSYMVNSRGGILGGLSSTCKRMDLEVSNLEYRFCRVAAFSPLLNRAMVRGTNAHPSDAIYMRDIYAEIVQQIEKIAAFDDGSLLNAWYKQHIDLIRAQMQTLWGKDHNNMSVARYMIVHTQERDKIHVLKKLLTFDSILFDLDLVHTIVNTDAQIILVVAGGMHIENMCTMLEKVGYVCTYKTLMGGTIYDTVAYVKSMVQSGDQTQPTALDLSSVKPLFLPAFSQ